MKTPSHGYYLDWEVGRSVTSDATQDQFIKAAVPGAVQLDWGFHPHLHALVADGLFTQGGLSRFLGCTCNLPTLKINLCA